MSINARLASGKNARLAPLKNATLVRGYKGLVGMVGRVLKESDGGWTGDTIEVPTAPYRIS